MEVTRTELCPGVGLTAIHTGKFKSATLSVTFLAPLDPARAAENALAVQVLRRGCAAWPTMVAISRRLEELYGGTLEPVVRKRGETQCVGLLGSFLDDAYTPGGPSNLAGACGLLEQMLLHPATQAGVFRADYVAGEKEKLIQDIRGERNDKGQYAILRLVRAMCPDEAYGVDRFGREEDVAAATPETVWSAYQALLRRAPVEIHYCGRATREELKTALAPLVEGLRACRTGGTVERPDCAVRAHAAHGAPRQVAEPMNVTQGKLALGFRTGGAWLGKQYPALLVFNALYGGSATSKLFLNVREKLSLCYYANSVLESLKGIMVVSSGVEFDKMDRAQREILTQLEAVKAGDFTAEELEGARRTLVSSYLSVPDGRGLLEHYYLTLAVAGGGVGPLELARQIEQVTADDVVRAARGVELDTVYRLVGEGVPA